MLLDRQGRRLGARNRAMGGQKLFDPRHVPGLVLWLRGDWSPITLNGSNVSQWNDISGNGNHAVQSTEANQPDDLASGINGRRNVNFVAANLDELRAGDTGENFGGFMAVFEPSGAIDKDTSPAQALLGDSVSTGQGVFLGAVTASLTNEIITVEGPSPNWRVGWTDASASISAAPHVLVVRWTGSTYEIRLDGEVKSVDTSGTPEQMPLDGVIFGNDGNPIAPLDAGVGELALFGGSGLSTSYATRLERYAAGVHGITLV